MAKEHKKYAIITPEVRQQFINAVESKQVTIKEAAEQFGIKFSTSKAILQTYRHQGRIGKKATRSKTVRVTNPINQKANSVQSSIDQVKSELTALQEVNFRLWITLMIKQQSLTTLSTIQSLNQIQEEVSTFILKTETDI